MTLGEARAGGFVKIHRRIESWELWRSFRGEQRAVVFALLLAANWKESAIWRGGRRVVVPRGCLADSLPTLARRAGTTIKVVRTTIRDLIAEGFLTGMETGTPVRLLRIEHYDEYQGGDEEPGTAPGTHRAGIGQGSGRDRARSEEREESEEREGGRDAPPPAAVTGASSNGKTSGFGPDDGGSIPSAPPTLRLVASEPPAEPPARKPNGRHATTIARLVTAFADARGSRYAFGAAADGAAVARLVKLEPDDAEIERRFRAGLVGGEPFRVDTIAQLASPRIWNHYAPRKAPPRPIDAAPTAANPIGWWHRLTGADLDEFERERAALYPALAGGPLGIREVQRGDGTWGTDPRLDAVIEKFKMRAIERAKGAV